MNIKCCNFFVNILWHSDKHLLGHLKPSFSMTNAPTSARKNHANAHIDNGVEESWKTYFF